MARKTLLAHQVESVKRVLMDADMDYCLEKPTGSGKTLEIVTLTSIWVRSGRKVLIASPQEHIENAFTDRDYDQVIMPSKTIEAPADLIVAARDDSDGSIAAIQAYLSDPDTTPGQMGCPTHAMACTHAALTRLRPPTEMERLPYVLKKAVLVVDEAHRAPATGLGQFVAAWKRAGGKVVFTTATAFRTDGDPVMLEGMVLIRRSLAEHLADPDCGPPDRVETAIHPIQVEAAEEAEFFGEEETQAEVRDAIVAQMVAAWEADGRPKTVVRVPVMKGGSSTMVAACVNAFTRAGARVLDVSGSKPADKTRFLTELPAERSKTRYDEASYDVLVGVQRVIEGLDWPFASDVYVVGLPRSVLIVMQLLGRATRRKLQVGYPAALKKRAKISFFVPCGSTTEDSLPAYHRRYTLLICSYLANSQAGEQWAIVKDVGRGLVVPLGVDVAATDVAAQWPYVDPTFRAQIEVAIAGAKASLLKAGSTAPDIDVLEAVYAARPDLNRSLVRQVLIELVVSQTGEAGDRVKRRLIAAIAAELKIDTPMKQAIHQAFNNVLLDLDSYAIVHSSVIEQIEVQTVALTGADILTVAGVLAQTRPLTPEWLCSVIREYMKQNRGRTPNEGTAGSPPSFPEETWTGIDRAIRTRSRNWPLESFTTLRQFVSEYVRRGTVGQMLDRYRRELVLSPAESALLGHLAKQRVRVRGGSVPLGEMPMPATTGAWPTNCLPAMRRWWLSVRPELPLFGDVHCWVMLDNLKRWIEKAGHAVPQLITTAEKNEIRALYVDRNVRIRVPEPDAWVIQETARAIPGDVGRAVITRCPLIIDGPGNLERADGVRSHVARETAGYVPSKISMRVRINSRKLAETFPVTPDHPEVEIPIDWVEALLPNSATGDEVPVTKDWETAVCQLPVQTFDAAEAA